MGDPLNDSRFKHIVTDPRFRKIPRSERKVKIDHRFKSMFTDDKFKLKYKVDKRGRNVIQTQSDNLKKYYELSEQEEDSDDNEPQAGPDKDDEVKVASESERDSDNEDSESKESDQVERTVANNEERTGADEPEKSKEEVLKERSKLVDNVHRSRINEGVSEKLKDLTMDYARGIGTLDSDESSSDESSSDDDEEIFHPWGELDGDAEETEDATCRLAVCNLDWDRITSKDLFVLFSSFLPPEGFIKSVTIYPSEFGMQRMKEEEKKGPKELFENPKFEEFDEDAFADKNSEGSQYCMEKLREYQLRRLRYYYAVITFDSCDSANKIYTECDGIEYESSATKVDLRFIPDDMEFDQEPKETCTSIPDITKYKPRLFINTALQQGTVRLTWDETDPNRVDFTRKLANGKKFNDDDIRAFVAASSGSDEDENEDEEENDKSTVVSPSHQNDGKKNDPISTYRNLLSNISAEENKKKPKLDMEVSWGVGLRDSESDSGDEIGAETKDTKEGTKGKKSKHDKKSHITNGTEEDEKKNAELQLLIADDAEEGMKSHFNFKNIQKDEQRKKKKGKYQKKKNGPDDKFQIDVNDDRFSALYTSHHFNIDPADPRFVRTEAAEEIIKEKRKRQKLNDKTADSPSTAKISKQSMNPELSSLVKSIKGKHRNS